MKRKLDEISELIEEMDFKARLYRTFEIEQAKRTYDEYIGLIVEQSNLNRDEKDNILDYWHKIKQDGYRDEDIK